MNNFTEDLKLLIKREYGDRKPLEENPNSTFDNNFSREIIIDWIRQEVLGGKFTFRREIFPPYIIANTLHKNKTDMPEKKLPGSFSLSWKRIFEMVEQTTTNDDGEEFNTITAKASQRVKIYFQLASLYTIWTINELNKCDTTDILRSRREANTKHYWGIEMDESLHIYICTYSHIHSIDNYIHHCRIKYRSWKYCNFPMINVMALAIYFAYYM